MEFVMIKKVIYILSGGKTDLKITSTNISGNFA